MKLTDKARATCSIEAILQNPAYTQYNFEPASRAEQHQIVSDYCEAISFVLGMHPSGDLAHFDNLLVVYTELGLLGYLPDQWESHTIMSPEDFIALFLATSRRGEGTRIYINNHE